MNRLAELQDEFESLEDDYNIFSLDWKVNLDIITDDEEITASEIAEQKDMVNAACRRAAEIMREAIAIAGDQKSIPWLWGCCTPEQMEKPVE